MKVDEEEGGLVIERLNSHSCWCTVTTLSVPKVSPETGSLQCSACEVPLAGVEGSPFGVWVLARVAGGPQTALSPHSWELGLRAPTGDFLSTALPVSAGEPGFCLSFLTTAQKGVTQTSVCCFAL